MVEAQSMTPPAPRVGLVAPLGRRVIRVASQAALLLSSLVLVYTGIVKLLDIQSFADALVAQGKLPADAIGAIANATPIAEVGLGAFGLGALALGSARAIAALVHAGVFLAFMAYVASLDAAPPVEPVSCGCGFRMGPVRDWTPLVIQNGVSAAVLAFAGIGLATSRPDASGRVG